MKFFSKEETKAVLVILAVIIAFSYSNFVVSLRKARDAQRKADIGSIYSALNEFQRDFGSFPLSKEGKIAACAPVVKKGKIYNLSELKYNFSVCLWGKDALRDLSDPAYPPYLKIIPQGDYHYLSNGNRYQIYGVLESKEEDEYDEAIVKRNLPCGNGVCNFGKGYGKTPLDISIEEYENELMSND